MAKEAYPKVYLYRRIVEAKLFIDSNYAKNIDVSNIADEACFSKFHFIRLFKNIYGKTPHQYLTRVRIEKAILLLRSGISASDTCYAVGFESLGSFSTLFKRMEGLSPSLFSAQQQFIRSQVMEAPLRFVPACYAYQHGWTENNPIEETIEIAG